MFRRKSSAPRIDAELRDHLDRLVALHVASGLSPEEARRQAILEFGNPEALRDACRDHRSLQWLDSIGADVRYGCRRLMKSPGFTAATVLSLALGIGAGTALFSILNAALLQLIQVRAPEELVWFHSGEHGRALSYPFYELIRGDDRFSGVLSAFPTPVNFTRNSATERVSAELVSGNYFTVLGVQPHLGRMLGPQDHRSPVAVVSYAYWQSALGADPSVMGRTVQINGAAWTIVGVAQQGFAGLDKAYHRALFVPMGMKPQVTPGWNGLDKPLIAWLYIVGRLKPDTDSAALATDLNGQFQAFQETHLRTERRLSEAQRATIRQRKLRLEPLREAVFDARVAQHLGTLTWAVALLIALACANVAGLLVARGIERHREIATRLAIGASRGRIVRQLMTENLLLALAGGIVALVLAASVAPVLAANFPLTGAGSRLDVRLDMNVLAFALTVSAASCALFGVAPAWQSIRPAKRKTAPLLLATQVSLSIVLLVAAGLFSMNLVRLLRHDAGYARGPMVLAEIDPTTSGYSNEQRIALYRAIESGLHDATLADVAPMSPYHGTSLFLVQGKPEINFIPRSLKVSPDYFRVMRIPLRSGRYLGPRDDERSPRVALISESLQRKVFPNEDPIGHRFVGDLRNRDASTYQIVGVVADVDLNDPRNRNSRECVYVSYLQAAFTPQAMTIHARVPPGGSAAAVTASVRRAVRDASPQLAVYDIRTIDEATDGLLAAERFVTVLTGFFAIAAALLCAIGIYGIAAREVAARTQEIGIRIALGCPRWSLASSVTGRAAKSTVIGLAGGLLVVVAIAPSLAPMLTEVHVFEPQIYLGAASLILTVSAAALAIPLRRAVSTDPAAALRHE